MTETNWKHDLIQKYPILFRRVKYIGVGDGWRHIVETACEMVDYRRQQDLKQLEIARASGAHDIAAKQEAMNKGKWPEVAQIKEKFGTLRFYCNYVTTKEDAYLEFAEVLSATVCDECGAPGKPTDSYGWLRTLCNEHKKVDTK